MTTETTPRLIETYGRDAWCLYGLWRVSVTVCDGCGAVVADADDHECGCATHVEARDIGCVIGVPEHRRGTARAAATNRGLLDAWYGDSSDWDDEGERDAALEIMRDAAELLCREHAVAE